MKSIVLMYHDVIPDGRMDLSGFHDLGADNYKIDTGVFRRHAQLIADNFGRVPVILTFDDGGIGALDSAGILEEFGWKGYFFVVTDRIGSPGFLDESQIRDLRRRGHLIGSHTCSHPGRMALCGPEQLEREWRDSARRLEGILGEPVTMASVPCGDYSSRVASAAVRAGIRTLFTSEPVVSQWKVDGCVVSGRFIVMRGISERRLEALLYGQGLTRFKLYFLWNLKKALKAVAGEGWLRARLWLLSLGRRRGPERDKPPSRR